MGCGDWDGGFRSAEIPVLHLHHGTSFWEDGSAVVAAAGHPCLTPTAAVVQRTPAVLPRALEPPQLTISSRLAQDRENVRQLGMQHKLEGMPIFSGNGQYVQLLLLLVDLGCEAALTAFAEGFMRRGVAERRASIRRSSPCSVSGGDHESRRRRIDDALPSSTLRGRPCTGNCSRSTPIEVLRWASTGSCRFSRPSIREGEGRSLFTSRTI